MKKNLFYISAGQISECSDPQGYSYKVRLIKAGLTASANTVIDGKPAFKEYTAEALKAAVASKLFEGAPAILRSTEDHLSVANSGVNQIVGYFSEVYWNEETQSVEGVFNVKRGEGFVGEFRQKLFDLWESTKDIGLSIAGYVHYKVKSAEGKFIAVVDKLLEIQSIDPVASGNAGGRFLTAAECEIKSTNFNNLTEKTMNSEMKAKIFAVLVSMKVIAEGKTVADYRDEDLIDIAHNALYTLSQANYLAEALQGLELKPKPAPAATAAEVKDDEKMKKIADELAEVKNKMHLAEVDKRVNGSNLPEVFKAKAIKHLTAKEYTPEEINDYLGEMQTALAEVNPAYVNNPAGGVRLVADKRDKVKMCFNYLFMSDKMRSGITAEERKAFAEAGALEVFSIKELYIALTGDTRVSGYVQPGRAAEGMLTTDFAAILGDSMRRVMLVEFQGSFWNQYWRKVCVVSETPDFRTKHLTQMGGYTDLLSVSEDGAFQTTTSPGEQEVTLAAGKKGYIDYITRENIINDDMGVVRNIPIKMGKAAARTLYKFAFNLFGSNPTMPYDTKALFHADHNNLLALALDAAGFMDARRLMRDQTQLTNGEKIGINPKYLIIPDNKDMEKAAYDLTTVAFGMANPVPQWVQTFQLEPILVPHFADGVWYMLADPQENPTVEIDFLQGQQNPEIFLQDTVASDSWFVNERLRWKIRHEYGGTPVDHRTMVKSVVPGV